MINTEGFSAAFLLKALYNHSRPIGRGILHYDPKPATLEECQTYIDKAGGRVYVDYLGGRLIKTEFYNEMKELDERLYDRDFGRGAAEYAILDEPA
jgi:hypothetical protein